MRVTGGTPPTVDTQVDDCERRRWSAWRVGLGLTLPLAAVVLMWVLLAWRRNILDEGGTVFVGAAPLMGRWRLDFKPEFVVAVVLGLALLVWWPPLVRRLAWNRLLPGSWLVSLGWTLAINMHGGWRRLGAPLDSRQDYLYTARNTVTDPFDFLRTFTRELRTYPIHVQGHPPGPVLGLEALERLGISGASGSALVLVGIACLASPLVLIAVRAGGRVGGQEGGGVRGADAVGHLGGNLGGRRVRCGGGGFRHSLGAGCRSVGRLARR